MDQASGSAVPAAAGPILRATPAPQAPRSESDRVPLLAWVIAAALVAAELAVSGRYGFFSDELYFIVCGRHLAFGYVDQPPLVPLLTRIMTGILGVRPTAIRIIPALAGGVIVVITARLAALLRAGQTGRVIAALAAACAPFIIGVAYLDVTTPLEMLAWAAVLLCVTTALLRGKPRWWLGAGVAAGLGLQDDNVLVLLLAGLAAGILVSGYRGVLRTRWPWLGGGIAAVIVAPDIAWQAMNGWPQLTMASVLHQENNTLPDYLGGPLAVVDYAGPLLIPLLIAGAVRLWRAPELRFLAVTSTLIVVYVLAWVPGKAYYAEGVGPAVLAAGALAAERWIAQGRRPLLRRGIMVAAPLVSAAMTVPLVLPVLPAADLSDLPASAQQFLATPNTVGWPQLAAAVTAQDAALTRAGQPPTSIFTEDADTAAALEVVGSGDRLPPVLSGNDAFWTWGPGHASDTVVLVVDAQTLAGLRPFFASCHVLTTFYAPFGLQNSYADVQIGVCTGPVASWHTLWPHLKRYD